jgi:hypothetical protein
MSRYNPFQYSNPVSPDDFVGRTRELRDVVGRIDNRGESTAITGPFRCGKTSMLQYISDPKVRATLYNEPDKLIFSYLNIGALSSECDPAQFWGRALKPLQERITADDTPASLSKAYQICHEKAFDNYELEKLFAQFKQVQWRLVLLLDEFDALLHHPSLKDKTEFFGGLRSLASLSKGALVVVITGNLSLSQLNQETQHFNPTGSPYFNIMDEVILGPLPEKAIDKILSQGDKHFTENDRHFLTEIAGGHPYLLQIAASILWDIYEYGDKEEPTKLQQRVEQELYLKVRETLNKIWQSWSPSMQNLFTSITLSHLEKLKVVFPKRYVDLESIMSQMFDVKEELNELERYGFLKKDESIRGGWGVYPSVFLLFIINHKLEPEYSKKLPKKIWEELFTPKILTNFSFLKKLGF